MLLGNGQHTTRATGRIINTHQTFFGKLGAVWLKHQFNHQADNIARRVKLPGSFITGFFKLTDQVFKNSPHAVVINIFRRQINFRERLGNFKNQAFTHQRFINGRQAFFFTTGKVVKNVFYVGREPRKVRRKIRHNIRRTANQFFQRIFRRVVKLLPGGFH